MWHKLALLGPLGRTVVIGIALVVLTTFTGTAWWTGRELGAQRCVDARLEAVQAALEREKKLRAADQRIAREHRQQLTDITARYQHARTELERIRASDADCDAYLSRPEPACARDFLYGVPARPGTGGP